MSDPEELSNSESEEDEETRKKKKEDKRLNILKGKGKRTYHVTYPAAFDKNEIRNCAKELTQDLAEDSKKKIKNEVRFILRTFKQRYCSCFCLGDNPFVCQCGLNKNYHRKEAIESGKARTAHLTEQKLADDQSPSQQSESNETGSIDAETVEKPTTKNPDTESKKSVTDDQLRIESVENERESENKTGDIENTPKTEDTPKKENTSKAEDTPKTENTAKLTRSESSTKEVQKWNAETCTNTEHPWCFGNVKMSSYYSKLNYAGTRKFLRMDDLTKDQGENIYTLLRDHWELPEPNLVMSVTGGDIQMMKENMKLNASFKNGIIKTAVTMEPWIITDGLHEGSTMEIGEIFGEDLKESEWFGDREKSKINLIGISPWGSIRDETQFMALHIGSNETFYRTGIGYGGDKTYYLDPFQTAYIFADNGKYDSYEHEPYIRKSLEDSFIGGRLVVLVVGGDKFTLKKVANALESRIPIVIVNGSGPIASMLADTYRALKQEKYHVKDENEKDKIIENLVPKQLDHFKEKKDLLGDKPEEHLKLIIEEMNLVTVFGTAVNEESELNTAILSALCGAVDDIVDELMLTLVMNRVDVARERLYTASRDGRLDIEEIERMLFAALLCNKAEFVQMLSDKNISPDFQYKLFLSKERLIKLYKVLFNPKEEIEDINELNINMQSVRTELTHDATLAKVLSSLAKTSSSGSEKTPDQNLLHQVGRLLYSLMGDNYRILYQEKYYRQHDLRDRQRVVRLRKENRLCPNPNEDGVWHFFFWAVLHNNREMIEKFINETSCKIGASLIACKILKELAKVTEKWHETELTEDLNNNSEYFEDLAFQIVDCMYKKDRNAAYVNLVTVLPIDLGQNVTPLFIADDAECMKFMGHACCQTLLDLIWTHNMVPGTPWWKLIPIIPFNICWIEFDGHDLYGMYKTHLVIKEDSTKEVKENEQNPKNKIKDEKKLKPIGDKAQQNSKVQDSDNSKTQQNTDSKAILDDFKKKTWLQMSRFRNYYQAPINKYIHGLVTYVVLLGLFSHLVLSELKPVNSAADISVYEWLIYIWVCSIAMQEIQQFVSSNSSGPLHNVKLDNEWRKTWSLPEVVYFTTRLYRFSLWLSDKWNQLDAVMIVLFMVSTVLRFTLPDVEFVLVRFFFSITLIFFYLRLLRIVYIFKALGPRIVTIRAMVSDLIQFFIVLSIFLVSFGIAFQSILEPRAQPSQHLLVNILWRPYWQMYGELFIDEDGLGREVEEKRCYSSRSRAEESNSEMCYDWLATLLLAVFMLITNIMLLNLLIAIFSHSFEKIESKSEPIWRYRLYGLIHEYYGIQWLPPPLNLLCIFANFCIYVQRAIRRKAYLRAKHSYLKRAQYDDDDSASMAEEEENTFRNRRGPPRSLKYINKKAQELMEADVLYQNFYLNDDKFEDLISDHFRRPRAERNTELEKWAYQKHKQNAESRSTMEAKVDNSLNDMSTWMQDMKSDLSEVKQQAREKQTEIQPNLTTSVQTEDISENRHQTRAGKKMMTKHGAPIGSEADKIVPFDTDQDFVKELEQLRSSMGNLASELKLEINSLEKQLQKFYDKQQSDIKPVLAYVNRRAKRREEQKLEAEKLSKQTN